MVELEEIRQILKDLAISQKETTALFKETDAMFKETDAKFKETDTKFKEIDAKSKESDSELKEIRAIMQKNALESDIEFKKQWKQIKEIGKQIGGIGERFGSFVEGLAYPSMRKVLYRNYGIDNTVANYLKRFSDGREIELDAFGFTNGSVNNAVVVEVKTNLQSKHIHLFKERLQSFKADFPEFSTKHLYGILATPKVLSKELKDEILNEGLNVAVVHDEIFDFKPNPKAIDFNFQN